MFSFGINIIWRVGCIFLICKTIIARDPVTQINQLASFTAKRVKLSAGFYRFITSGASVSHSMQQCNSNFTVSLVWAGRSDVVGCSMKRIANRCLPPLISG